MDLKDKKANQLLEKRQLMVALEEEIEQTQREHDDCARILSSMRIIPAEILSEIFILCIPEDSALHNGQHPGSRYNSLDAKSPPWIVAQVSRHWRETALSCPRLWSQVTLILDKRYKTAAYVNKVEPALKLSLARSKQTMLFASLDCTAFSLGPNMTAALRRLIKSFLDTSNRWESLLLIVKRSCRDHIIPSLTGQVPNLKSLYVCPNQHRHTSFAYNRIALFKDATLLSHFGGSVGALEHYTLPSSRLSEFTEFSPHGFDSLDPLLQLTNLKILTLMMYEGRTSTRKTTQDTFHALTDLKIIGGGDAAKLLKALKFPKLRTLSISINQCTDFESLREILIDSNASLIEFEVTFDRTYFGVHWQAELAAFITFLESSPALECFSVHSIPQNVSQTLLTKLATDLSTFLPNLRRFEALGESKYTQRLMDKLELQRPTLHIVHSLNPDTPHPVLSISKVKKANKATPKHADVDDASYSDASYGGKKGKGRKFTSRSAQQSRASAVNYPGDSDSDSESEY
jgi:hypothetical protein